MITVMCKKRVRVVSDEDTLVYAKWSHMGINNRRGATRHWGILIGTYGKDKSLVKFTDVDNRVVVKAFDNNLIEEI